MTEPPAPQPPRPSAPKVVQIKSSQVGSGSKARKQKDVLTSEQEAEKKERQLKASRLNLQRANQVRAERAQNGGSPSKPANDSTTPAPAKPASKPAAAKPGPKPSPKAAAATPKVEASEDGDGDEPSDGLGADDDGELDAADLEAADPAEPPMPREPPMQAEYDPALHHSREETDKRKIVDKGGTLDPEVAAHNDAYQAKLKAVRNGEPVAKWMRAMSDEQNYNIYAEAEATTGRLVVFLTRHAPNLHTFKAVNVRRIPSWADFVSWVQNYFWDGQKTLFTFEMKLSGTKRCQGQVPCGYDANRAADWARMQAAGTLPRWDDWEGVPPPLTPPPPPPGQAQNGQPANGATMTNGQQPNPYGYCMHCSAPRVQGGTFCAGCGKPAAATPQATPAAPAAPAATDTQIVTHPDGSQWLSFQGKLFPASQQAMTPQTQTVAPGDQLVTHPDGSQWLLHNGRLFPRDLPAPAPPPPSGDQIVIHPDGSKYLLHNGRLYPEKPVVAPAPATPATPSPPAVVDGIPTTAQLGYWQPGSEDFWPADWRKVPLPKGVTRGYYDGGNYFTVGPPTAAPTAAQAAATTALAAPQTLSQKMTEIASARNEIVQLGGAIGLQIAPTGAVADGAAAAAEAAKKAGEEKWTATIGDFEVPFDKNGLPDTNAPAHLMAMANSGKIMVFAKGLLDTVFDRVDKTIALSTEKKAVELQYLAALKEANEVEAQRLANVEKAQRLGVAPAPVAQIVREAAAAANGNGIGVRDKENGHANGQTQAGGPAAAGAVASEDGEDQAVWAGLE